MYEIAILISLLLPVYEQPGNIRLSELNTSYAVRAVIDAAKIIGLPATKNVKDQSLNRQKPSYLDQESSQIQKPIPWRKEFFLEYFKQE